LLDTEGHVQVLLNVLRGMTPQAALDAPRFCISAGLPDADTEDAANAGNIDSEVWMEEGISDEVVEKLRGMSPSFIVVKSLVSGLTFNLCFCQKWDTTQGRRATSIDLLSAEGRSSRKSPTVREGRSGLADQISGPTDKLLDRSEV
jgi:hypothetical protein